MNDVCVCMCVHRYVEGAFKARQMEQEAEALVRKIESLDVSEDGDDKKKSDTVVSSSSSSSTYSSENATTVLINGDLFASNGTAEAARLSAGCAVEAVVAVASGRVQRSFAVVCH